MKPRIQRRVSQAAPGVLFRRRGGGPAILPRPQSAEKAVAGGGLRRTGTLHAGLRHPPRHVSVLLHRVCGPRRRRVKAQGSHLSAATRTIILLWPGHSAPHYRRRGQSAGQILCGFRWCARQRTLLRSCGLSPGRVSEVFPANALQPLFDELSRPGRRCARECEASVRPVAGVPGAANSGARAPLQGAETLAFTTYQRCRRYMEQHVLRLRTLDKSPASAT